MRNKLRDTFPLDNWENPDWKGNKANTFRQLTFFSYARSPNSLISLGQGRAELVFKPSGFAWQGFFCNLHPLGCWPPSMKPAFPRDFVARGATDFLMVRVSFELPDLSFLNHYCKHSPFWREFYFTSFGIEMTRHMLSSQGFTGSSRDHTTLGCRRRRLKA